MEDLQNERWLEAAYENFETAKHNGDIAMAKAVVADMFDAGFAIEARRLAEELRKL